MNNLLQQIRQARNNPQEQWDLAFFGHPVTGLQRALYFYFQAPEDGAAVYKLIEEILRAIGSRDFLAIEALANSLKHGVRSIYDRDHWMTQLASWKLRFWNKQKSQYQGPVLSTAELARQLGYAQNLTTWARKVKAIGIPVRESRGRPRQWEQRPLTELELDQRSSEWRRLPVAQLEFDWRKRVLTITNKSSPGDEKTTLWQSPLFQELMHRMGLQGKIPITDTIPETKVVLNGKGRGENKRHGKQQSDKTKRAIRGQAARAS